MLSRARQEYPKGQTNIHPRQEPNLQVFRRLDGIGTTTSERRPFLSIGDLNHVVMVAWMNVWNRMVSNVLKLYLQKKFIHLKAVCGKSDFIIT